MPHPRLTRATLTCLAVSILAMSRVLPGPANVRGGEITFQDISESAGIAQPLAGLMGHGGAWGDYDGDGRPDLVVGGFCDRPNAEYAPAAGPIPNQLLRNLGNGRFEVMPIPEIQRFGRTSGAVFADLDNDGRLDLYIANNAKAGPAKSGTPEPQASAKGLRSLLLKNGDGQWSDVSAASGACPDELQTARNIAPIDVDGDGKLDLLVIEDRFRKGPRSRLFRNLGNFQFRDVSEEYGLPADLYGLGHAVADLNNDRRPDFVIGHSNRCFLSTPGGGYVESQSVNSALAWTPLHGEDWPCGIAIGDLNRDGLADIVIAAHCETARNRVLLQTVLEKGEPRFRDVTAEIGLPTSIPIKCPHVEIQDFDNDGWPDLYFSAGWKQADGSVIPLIFRHAGLKDGLPRFFAPPEPKGQMVYYPAAPSADFDADGRLDLFLVNWFAGDHCHLLRNTSPAKSWLQVTVSGKTFNRMGLGSRVEVYPAGQLGNAQQLWGMQELQIGGGYASGHEAACHFGLGSQSAVDVRVRFPDGRIVEHRDVPANQRLTLTE